MKKDRLFFSSQRPAHFFRSIPLWLKQYFLLALGISSAGIVFAELLSAPVIKPSSVPKLLVEGQEVKQTTLQTVTQTKVAPTPAQASFLPPYPLMATDPSQTKKQFFYQKIQPNVVQIRILLHDKSSQSSSGSGFYASSDGLVITNYHVISELALEPEKHYAVYVSPNGKEGEIELLAIDAIHDLAIMHIPGTLNHDKLELAADKTLIEGDHLYSLGNPLDIGFAVTEGIYNGLVKRQQLPHYFFSGVINSGMSGGPALNTSGQVVGVNVSARTDGESVSFLVPIRFAKTLLEQAKKNHPIKSTRYPEVTEQLTHYQQKLVDTFLSQPRRFYRYGHYQAPIFLENISRCLGENTDSEMISKNINCRMESGIYTGEDINNEEEEMGYLEMSYDFYDGSEVMISRFLTAYSKGFSKGSTSISNSRYALPQCHEDVIRQQGVMLKTAVCFRAHRKFSGLVHVSVVVAPLNTTKKGFIGRFYAVGVSYENGLKLVDRYIKGFSWIS